MKTEGLRAIITGATGGIGRATVAALLERGAARVGLLARDPAKLEALVSELGDDCRERVVPLLADLREPEALEAAFQTFGAAAEGLDLLVNNAGVLLDGALLAVSFKGISKYPLDAWHETLETNLTGPFLCTQLAVEAMVRKRVKGLIVNLSSISRAGRAGQSAYSTSKGGLASLTHTLAQELAPYKIRCCAVAPGLVDTPMAERIPESSRETMLKAVAAGRMGTPEEVAHALVFCIENDFFNGRVLELDGGAFG